MANKKTRTVRKAPQQDREVTISPEDQQDPRKLFQLIKDAERQEEAAREVRKEALRFLRESLSSSTFTANGQVYQIRERGGDPYLVTMPTGKVVNL